MNAALKEAEAIAQTAVILGEVLQGSHRVLLGFDAAPGLFVVAPRGTKPLGLALLILEQITIIRAANHVAQTTGQALIDMHAGGTLQ